MPADVLEGPSRLLGAAGDDQRWNNLGLWAAGRDYPAACRALARLHGEAAGLRSGHHLLELGCGYGAALELWREEFGVTTLHALDRRTACIDYVRATGHVRPEQAVAARFDEPLSPHLPSAAFDAVICVDAAYHARSLAALLAATRPLLRPDGALVFSTLLRGSGFPDRQPLQRVLLRLQLAAARITPAALAAPADLPALLARHGLRLAACQTLTMPVLGGFASWVAAREAALSRAERRSGNWLKARLTARWCERLLATRQLDYVLISASATREI